MGFDSFLSNHIQENLSMPRAVGKHTTGHKHGLQDGAQPGDDAASNGAADSTPPVENAALQDWAAAPTPESTWLKGFLCQASHVKHKKRSWDNRLASYGLQA